MLSVGAESFADALCTSTASMIIPDEEVLFFPEKPEVVDWVLTERPPPNSALAQHANGLSSAIRCFSNVASSQTMPLKPLTESNVASAAVTTLVKSESKEKSMNTSELRLYKACLSNGVDVSSWPAHDDVCYKEKIENFRLLNRQARARNRRKGAPTSKSREASIGETNQPMDLSTSENSATPSTSVFIRLNPPIPPLAVANTSGWVLPVLTVASEVQATNHFLPIASCPPILPQTSTDPFASSTCSSSLHIPLPTPPSDRLVSSSSTSSAPHERDHLQTSTTLPAGPNTDSRPPPSSTSPTAARKRKSTKPMRRLFLNDLETSQTCRSPTASSTGAQTVLENKENQFPETAPNTLPTDSSHAANTDVVPPPFSCHVECKPENTAQEKETPTESGSATENVLEVQTCIKMDPDSLPDYGHYKVLVPSPNRKSIRLRLKKIPANKEEVKTPGSAEATSPDQKATCKICHEDCGSFRGLRKHIRSRHPKLKEPTVCDICGDDCGSLKRLRAHVRSQHPITKVHRCEVCNKEFSQECSLVYHLAFMHSRDSPYECQECHQKFVTDGWLRSHIEREHGSRTYPCNSCKYTFPTKVRLRMHVRRCHQGLKKIACDQCEKRFATSAGLDLHVKSIHEGLKPYECQVCQKRFTQPNVLKYHCVRFHAGMMHLILGRPSEEGPSTSL
ncbi:hypothetical protein AAHC03_025944 [Spirometra sp. Aus1]